LFSSVKCARERAARLAAKVMVGTLLRNYSIPRRFAFVASLRTGHTVPGMAFAEHGSPMDLALRARLRRFRNDQVLTVQQLH